LTAVRPFKAGLYFHISSHQAAALTEDWSAVADFFASPAANYSTDRLSLNTPLQTQGGNGGFEALILRK